MLSILYKGQSTTRAMAGQKRPPASFHLSRSLSLLIILGAVPGCLDGRETDGEEELNRLSTLSYVASVPVEAENRGKSGVTLHLVSKTERGNVLLSKTDAVVLIDQQGVVLRKLALKEAGIGAISEAEPLPDGGLLVVEIDKSLIRLDPDWRILWRASVAAHHDATTFGDKIYVLTRKLEKFELMGEQVPILSDYITVLSDRGHVLDEISLARAAQSFLTASHLERIKKYVKEAGDPLVKTWERLPQDTALDLLHSNYVHVIDRDIEGVCRIGDILVSMRDINLVAILDPVDRQIRWSWGPELLDGQHQPVLLDSGNILVFDNGRKRSWSRILEIDPVSKRIVWSYPAERDPLFFSHWGGTVERLSNGNTAITETAKGRLLEVTKEGDVVWEYWASQRSGRRDTIKRSHRVSPTWGRRDGNGGT